MSRYLSFQDDEGGGEASELDLDNVGGVFVVLVCGVVMACVVTVCEVVWNISMIAKKEKVSLIAIFRFDVFHLS